MALTSYSLMALLRISVIHICRAEVLFHGYRSLSSLHPAHDSVLLYFPFQFYNFSMIFVIKKSFILKLFLFVLTEIWFPCRRNYILKILSSVEYIFACLSNIMGQEEKQKWFFLITTTSSTERTATQQPLLLWGLFCRHCWLVSTGPSNQSSIEVPNWCPW